jgi:hypothetical protein
VKTLTNAMKLALILAVLAILLLGWGTVWSHVKAVQVESAERISSVASDSHEANRIRVLLRASDEKILVHQDKLADVELQRARIASEIVALRGRIANQREILARARTLLSDPDRATMDVNGRSYTRQQVEEDAVARVSNLKALSANLQLQEQVIGRLDAALRDGSANLAKARQIREENVEQLNLLEIRLQNARVIESVTTFAQGLDEDPLGPQSELGKAFRGFERRVASLERRNDGVTAEHRPGMIVDYETSSRINAIDAIDGVLGHADEGSSATGQQRGRLNSGEVMDELTTVLNGGDDTQ